MDHSNSGYKQAPHRQAEQDQADNTDYGHGDWMTDKSRVRCPVGWVLPRQPPVLQEVSRPMCTKQ